MSGAYRESAAVARAPLEEIAWRRRVGKGAQQLGAALGVAVCWASPEPFVELHAARTVLLFAVIPAAWMMTTPRPGRRRDWLAWSLMASVSGGAILSALALAGTMGSLPGAVLASVALVAGLAFLARLHAGAGRRREAWLARALVLPASGLVAASVFKLPSAAEYVLWGPGLVSALLAFGLASRFASRAEVKRHSWWLDDGAASPGEWVSLLVHNDEHAEVISVEGQLGSFASQDEACDWLELHGYVWGEAAIADGLVAAQPPDVLLEKKSRIGKLLVNASRARRLPR